ncbi:glutaminase GtaA [Thozetella sp. PMI_491]|nr:glutaminase GtaA [Thozetella sp. PMI_491]
MESFPAYLPARPPAIPLAVRNPYTSAWSTTLNGGTLNSQEVMFWDGTPLGWEGIVVVDGTSYEYMGSGFKDFPGIPELKAAVPLEVRYDSQYSNFTFLAGPVQINAIFFSPVTPKDICRTSIPLSYLTTTVESLDGTPHSVQFYSDVNAGWISKESNKTIAWNIYHGAETADGPLHSWVYHQQSPITFAEDHDFPEWGNFTYTTSPAGAKRFSFQSGFSADVRYKFVKNHYLDDAVVTEYRGWRYHDTVFAFSHDMGTISSSTIRYTIGSIQIPVIKYLHTGGLAALRPWWEKCYNDMYSMINFHWNDFEAQNMFAADMESLPDGSEAVSYYAIVALSARQIMGAYIYAIPPEQRGSEGTASLHPLLFQKELSSGANVNTVDVLYPAMPFLLWANPEMLRYALQPLLENQESGFYPNGYCMHDLGVAFPNATGHVEGTDEYMPVEESGNFILMAYAYYQFSGDTAWLSSHYDLLAQFAEYLITFGLVPATQLSTDDFAGKLANQTNLALKAIIGLHAMANVARVTGHAAEAVLLAQTAREYYAQWETLAIDPTGTHTLLAYQWYGSWGMLYNIYADKLLQLGVVAQPVYDLLSAFYPTVAQIYGVPLDSRHHYTKSDWMMWTAAACSSTTRRIIVDSLARWINSSFSRGPCHDLFEAIGEGAPPELPGFRARPVAGGHFSLLALHSRSLKNKPQTK